MKLQNIKRFRILLAAAALIAACGHKTVLIDQTTAAKSEKDILTVVVGALKEKYNRFEIQLALTNENSKPEIVLLKDMQCSGSGRDGVLRMEGIRRGDGFTITLKSQETKTFYFICDLSAPPVGPYQVTITQVYENPNGDGRTSSKILTKNLVIKQSGQLHSD